MYIFCRRVIISKPEMLTEKGPLLLACNHPNSFLDAIILDMLFEQPIWSLTRGDVFKKPLYARILASLKMLPVYRTSEGAENLSINYQTFNICQQIFKEKGIVIMFSQGKSINEWHLRKLKKGTARLAIKSWKEGIPLRVLPIGINYSSFGRFGKNVYLNFGEMISSDLINFDDADGLQHQTFNKKLNDALQELVFEIPKEDRQLQKEKLKVPVSWPKKILLAIPAIPGYLLHLPLYMPVQSYTKKRTWHNDHFDSIMVAVLFIIYPLYLILLITLTFLFTKSWWALSLFLVLPFCAWAYVQLKPHWINNS